MGDNLTSSSRQRLPLMKSFDTPAGYAAEEWRLRVVFGLELLFFRSAPNSSRDVLKVRTCITTLFVSVFFNLFCKIIIKARRVSALILHRFEEAVNGASKGQRTVRAALAASAPRD